MKYTIEMFCCDSCHSRATNNDVMNGILGYKNSDGWKTRTECNETSVKYIHFCSDECEINWKNNKC
jgi:hypothetical protein